MTEPPTMSREEVLRIKMGLLQREHRDLDEAIEALHKDGKVDQLTLRRLKKRKLMLKDRIALIERMLEPDEPA